MGHERDGGVHRYRAIFISDVHLGTRGCRVDDVADFLHRFDADRIYLVGDIVDVWALRACRYWPRAHGEMLRKALRKARTGAEIVYIPGNHDDFLRAHVGRRVAGIEIVRDAIHVGADGRRYLVVHGDMFDVVVRQGEWVKNLCDWIYDAAIWTNAHLADVRRRLGLPYWSFAKWGKLKVKNFVDFIVRFEKMVADEARRRGADGVICGHIHHAAIKDADGVRYMNCGDWVESCTALVERHDGEFEIVHWTKRGPEPAAAKAASAIRALPSGIVATARAKADAAMRRSLPEGGAN